MNFFFSHQDHPTITLHDLADFAEDANAAKIFERRFQPMICGGAAIVFVGFGVFVFFVFRAREQGDTSALATYGPSVVALFAVGGALVFGGYHQMSKAIPVSPQSGQQMEVYRLEDTVKDGKFELIYVCRKSRTYFRRVFSEPVEM